MRSAARASLSFGRSSFRPFLARRMQNPWAREYARTPERYIWGKTPSGFAREIADRLSAGSRVLDLGCGEGRDSVYFAARGFEVTGLDVSPEAVAKGRRLAEEREVQVQWLCRSPAPAGPQSALPAAPAPERAGRPSRPRRLHGPDDLPGKGRGNRLFRQRGATGLLRWMDH